MDQNINNQIPVPKPPKFQKIESNQMSELDLNKTEQSENIVKSPEASVSDIRFRKFLRFVIIGIIAIFIFLYLAGGQAGESCNIFCRSFRYVVPNISLEGESFFYFFGSVFLTIITIFIILIVNLIFNKKASHSTNKVSRSINILGIVILIPFVFFIFLFIFGLMQA